MKWQVLLIFVVSNWIQQSDPSQAEDYTQCGRVGIPLCPLSHHVAQPDINSSAITPDRCTKVPVVETVAVTVTETITTDTLTETTTVTSTETSTPLYLQSIHPTISVPYNDHCSNSQGDIKKGSSREKVLGALLALFVVLFIIMTVGWMWSYWRTKEPRTSLTMETAQARVNELNYDTIPTDEVLLQLQNCSVSGPTTLQLHTNQAYESQQTCHSSDEPIYETIPIKKAGQREMIKTVGC